MEAEKNYTWDEIVYEYKNKEYGAFYLKQKYNKSLFTAIILGILILFIVVLPIHVMYNKYKNISEIIIDNSVNVNLMYVKHQKKDSPPPTQLPPIDKIKQETKALTQVVDDVKDDIIIPTSTQIYDSTDNKVTHDITSTDTSTVNSDGTVDFLTIEEKPEFPGGETAMMRWISSNVKYPEQAKENGITGKVFILFVINKEGKVTNVELLKGVDPYLDKEALRVISSMPVWKPGRQGGKPIRVSYKLPLNFKL